MVYSQINKAYHCIVRSCCIIVLTHTHVHTPSLEMFCQYSKAFCPREEMVFEDWQALVSGVLTPSLVLLCREPSSLTEYTHLHIVCVCVCECVWGGGCVEGVGDTN
jgi:hypothetical protein